MRCGFALEGRGCVAGISRRSHVSSLPTVAQTAPVAPRFAPDLACHFLPFLLAAAYSSSLFSLLIREFSRSK